MTALPQVNLGSVQQQLAALALGGAGGERISPTLDAILELLDEAPADDAAAAADAFVEQVAEAAGAGDAGAMPWAAVQADAAAEGGEEPQGEAAMEGVVGEYAYAAPPDLADAPGGAGGLLGMVGCRVRCASRMASELRCQRATLGSTMHVALCVLCASHAPRPAAVPCVPSSDDYDDDGGFGGDDDYYDAESELPGEDQEGQAAAAGGEEGAVDQVGNDSTSREEPSLQIRCSWDDSAFVTARPS